MSLPALPPLHADHLLQRCLANLPKTLTPERYRLYEDSTRAAVDALLDRLNAPQPGIDLVAVERDVTAALAAQEPPPWLIRSRVVLVFRDCMRDAEFRRQVEALPRKARRDLLAVWSEMGADLYRHWPDRRVMNTPDAAVKILSGEDQVLRQPLTTSIAQATGTPSGEGDAPALCDAQVRAFAYHLDA